MDSHNKPTLDLVMIRKASDAALLHVLDDQHWFHQVPLLCDEVERLRKALQEIERLSTTGFAGLEDARDIARKALES